MALIASRENVELFEVKQNSIRHVRVNVFETLGSHIRMNKTADDVIKPGSRKRAELEDSQR
jgi:hypothetical protein